MEVSGRRPDKDPKTASAEDPDLFCQPCSHDGKQEPARLFCVDCQEHLCGDCCVHHRKFRALRHHNLLPLGDVSSAPVKNQEDIPTITCLDHVGKSLDFTCYDHSKVFCAVCAVVMHRHCKIDYIPDISSGYEKSDEYRKIIEDLDQLEKDTSQVLSHVEINIRKTEENGEKLIDDIRKLRHDMNEYLKRMEEDLLFTFQMMLDEDLKSLRNLTTACESVKCEISKMNKRLENLKGRSSDLLISTKMIMKQIPQLRRSVDKYSKENRASSYKFKKHEVFKDLIAKSKEIGTVTRVLHQEKTPVHTKLMTHVKPPSDSITHDTHLGLAKANISRVPDIDTKSAQDFNNSYIAAMLLLPPDKLFLLDINNECMKCLDITTSKITSRKPLSSAPHDMTFFGENLAAVTFPWTQQIEVISIDNGLSTESTIAVNGNCFGIAAAVDKLVVSFEKPGKLEVLDPFGAVLHTIGADMFVSPLYVNVINENAQEVIFVSDYETNTVSKLTMKGKVLYRYKDTSLKRPEGLVAMDDGHLLVCAWKSSIVQLLSPFGKKVRTILTSKDGIDCPSAICYCAARNHLYVGCGRDFTRTGNQLKLYRIS